MLGGEQGQAEGGEQPVAGEVTGGPVTGDAPGCPAGCVQPGDRPVVAVEHPRVAVDQQAALGVEQRRPHVDRLVRRGERRLSEVTLDWLGGYEGARPVRIGNGAYTQFQLDVLGEFAGVLYIHAQQAGKLGARGAKALKNVATRVS